MTVRSLRDLLLLFVTFPLMLGWLPPEWVGAIVSRTDTMQAYSAPSTPQQPTAHSVRPYHVGIQSGHYKENELPDVLARLSGDSGTAGGGRTEVDLNFDISNRVAKLLLAQGIAVDVLPATVSTGYAADAFVAIHADGNASPAPRGFKISTRWNSNVAVQDVSLVEALTSAYRAATGLPEDSAVTRNMRGYYAYAPYRASYRTSNYTPGAIVEMGYMSNAADRSVMFNAADKVAAGIANGIIDFLKATYGSPPRDGSYRYGYGIVDKDINPLATPVPTPRGGYAANPTPDPRPRVGDWHLVLMGRPAINIYSGPGGQGPLVAKIAPDQILHSTLYQSNYYQVTLPDGIKGWVSRNSVVGQL